MIQWFTVFIISIPFQIWQSTKNRNWNYATNQTQNTVLAKAYLCGCMLLNLYNVRDQDTVHLIYYKALWDTLIWLVDCCSQVTYPCRSWQWQLIRLIKPCYFHTVEFYTLVSYKCYLCHFIYLSCISVTVKLHSSPQNSNSVINY